MSMKPGKVALSLSVALAGCGGDSFSPTVETIAGAYTASTFTVTGSDGTTDQLASGATVSVTLAEDGSTTGHVFVPGGAEDGGNFEADLAGTWSLAGTTVTFSQTADTFIRDIQFTASKNRLTGEGTFEDVTIRLVLARTG
jgi:hypothetical protein